MCIIVDTNKLKTFLADPPDDDAKPIRKWLDRGKGSVVYSTGGKFGQEIQHPAIQHRAKAKLENYVRAGRAKLIPWCRFAADERYLKTRTDIRSDDWHVLALAREAGVRLLHGRQQFDFGLQGQEHHQRAEREGVLR